MYQTHFIVYPIYIRVFAYLIYFLLEKIFSLFLWVTYSLLNSKEKIICRMSTECVNTKMFLSYNSSSKLELLVLWFSLMFSKYESLPAKIYHRHLKN